MGRKWLSRITSAARAVAPVRDWGVGELEDIAAAQRDAESSRKAKFAQAQTDLSRLCAEFATLMKSHSIPSLPYFHLSTSEQKRWGSWVKTETYTYAGEYWVISDHSDHGTHVVTSDGRAVGLETGIVRTYGEKTKFVLDERAKAAVRRSRDHPGVSFIPYERGSGSFSADDLAHAVGRYIDG